jgi:amino acid adenylation domain-containing protein
MRNRRLPLTRERSRAEPESEVRAVSSVQRGFWFLDEVFPETTVNNVCAAVKLRGTLDTAVAQESLAEIVRRHDILRATFPAQAGEPVMQISGFRAPTMPVVDLSGLPTSAIEAESARLERTHARHVFDLRRGPLMRAVLVRQDVGAHTLLINMHHIVSDAWSVGVVVDEFLAAYEVLAEGRPVTWASPGQYADVMMRVETKRLPDRESHLRYWQERLGDLAGPCRLPPDLGPAPDEAAYAAALRRSISLDTTAAMRRFARAESATPFTVLLTAFEIALVRYLDRGDVVVGVASALRGDPDTDRVIGPFINMVALRTDLTGDPPVREALARVRDTCFDAYEHQAVAFEEVISEVAAGRELWRNPFFSITFQTADLQPEQSSRGGLTAQVTDVELEQARFDLSVDVSGVDGRLDVAAHYNRDLYRTETIDALLRHWLTILRHMVTAADMPVSQIAMTDQAERQVLLTGARGAAIAAPRGDCVLDLFEEHAATQPAAPAVISGGIAWSYRELDRAANQLAHRALGEGVRPGDRVGIYMERSAETVAAVLAVWKAGAAYVPLDIDSPASRRHRILADAGIAVVLTQRRLADDLRSDPVRLLIADAGQPTDSVSRGAGPRPPRTTSPEALCYVIYTSGSTGQPKGVMSTHGALMHVESAWEQVLGLRGRVRRHLQMANFSFDGYLGELIRCLGSGGALVICPRESLLVPSELLDIMRAESVDAADFVPTVLRTLVSHVMDTREDLGFLKVLIVGSETFPADELARVRALCGPQTTVINCYGLTEGTIDSTYFAIGDAPGTQEVLIGVPLPGVETYLLDSALRPVPPSVPGTIYLAGPTVSRGYLGDPTRTAELFVPDPWSEQPGTRMYRTGDRARYRRTDLGLVIEYLGRTDQQLKIRGYRVELGEIEAALRRSSGVEDAVVVTDGDGAQRKVHAYVVPRSSVDSGADWFAVLRDNVPLYMLPDRIVLLDRLPLTANGKLDRAALPAAGGGEVTFRSSRHESARTSTETSLIRHWEQVLNRAGLGVNDDFFAFGGNSLLAMQAIAMARDEWGVDVSVRTFFLASTVADLAREVEKLKTGGQPARADQITAVRRQHLGRGTTQK